MENYIEKILEYASNELDFEKVTSSNVISDGVRYSKKKFVEEKFTPAVLKEIGCLEVIAMNDKDRGALWSEFWKSVTFSLRPQMPGDDIELPESQLDRFSYVPMIDVESGDVVMVNKSTRQLSSLNPAVWEKTMDKDTKNMFYQQMRDVKLEYDPYNLNTFTMVPFEDRQILRVNTYKPPRWRTMDPPDRDDVKCPEVLEKVLRHLFPTEESYTYVLNWLYHALVGRNETYLVLNGAKGTGKGTFANMTKMLVGRENFNDAPVSLLTGQFNAALDKKRVVYLDEFKVGKSEHTRLKKYINKHQSIEKKGVDADRSIEIYNSYIISNNDDSDMYLESDDRRFSVVDITRTPLLRIMSKEEISELDRRLQDDENLAYEFGYFIFYHGKSTKYDHVVPFKGERFYELAYNSLSEWQRFLLDKINSRESAEYRRSDLAREFQRNNKVVKFPTTLKKISDFCKNFKHDGYESIAECGYDDENEIIIVPADEFLPIGSAVLDPTDMI